MKIHLNMLDVHDMLDAQEASQARVAVDQDAAGEHERGVKAGQLVRDMANGFGVRSTARGASQARSDAESDSVGRKEGPPNEGEVKARHENAECHKKSMRAKRCRESVDLIFTNSAKPKYVEDENTDGKF